MPKLSSKWRILKKKSFQVMSRMFLSPLFREFVHLIMGIALPPDLNPGASGFLGNGSVSIYFIDYKPKSCWITTYFFVVVDDVSIRLNHYYNNQHRLVHQRVFWPCHSSLWLMFRILQADGQLSFIIESEKPRAQCHKTELLRCLWA